VSDCSENPFFARKKLWQKKDCNGKRGFIKIAWIKFWIFMEHAQNRKI
jgi:hypothetical protein